MKPNNDGNKFLNNLKNILGMLGEKDAVPSTPHKGNYYGDYQVKNIYSQSELERLPGFSKSATLNASNETNILTEYLRQLSLNIASNEEKIRNYNAINPEIRKARQIYVSSIMSPNDLQSNEVKIILENSELEPELRDAVVEYLNEFFGKQYSLGTKLAQWIGDYTYEMDAKPIMIVPKSNIDDITKLHDDIEAGNVGMYTEDEKIIITDAELESDFVNIVSCEAYELFRPIMDPSGKKIVGKDVVQKIAGATVKEINSGFFNFTADVSKVARLKQVFDQKYKKNQETIINRMYHAFQGAGTNILALSNKLTEKDLQPIVMELPAKAVIPIVVPGSKTEHLGYFIIMDEWGNPLSVLDSNFTFMNEDEKLAKLSTLSMFASPSSVFGTNLLNNPEQRLQLTQSIFGIAMKSVLKDKFRENQLIDIPVKEYEAISKFLFHQLLNKNKTTILFVPSDLIVYYCDSFRDDGSGQSKVSGIDFALSLRTTLLVSGVMGAIRASIDSETYEVMVDEKNTNPFQTVNTVRDNAIAKKAFDFTNTNPLSISRSIAESAITVYPKGIKGSSFEITKSKDATSSDYRRPDETLMETVNNMVIDNLGVPPSALNKLSEDEYAKSVSTINVIFSNEIRKAQRFICDTTKKFIVNYLRFSLNNQQDLIKIFNKFNGSDNTDETNDDKQDGTISVDEHGERTSLKDKELRFLKDVLTNLEIFLPPPNIAVTKSHLEDLQSELEFIDTVCEKIYSEELITVDSEEAKSFIKGCVAFIKAKLCREILEKSTLHSSMEFTNIDEIDVVEMSKMYKASLNKGKALSNLHNAIQQNLSAQQDKIIDNF